MKHGIKILLGVLAISTSAFAEKKPVKFGSEVRISVINSDNGFEKTDTNTPDSSTVIKAERFNFQLIGDIEENLSYRWRLNALTSETEYAYIRWKALDALTISIGKGWVAQGGLAYFTLPLKRYFFPTPTMINLPMDHYKKMLQLDYLLDGIGNFTFQVFDDKADRVRGHVPRTNEWNSGNGTHPTFAFMFMTKAAGFSPMLQYGSYDNNHSSWMSFGTGFDISGLTGLVNYYADSRSKKDVTKPTEPADAFDKTTTIDFEVAYAVSPKLSPYVFYSKFDIVQDGTDREGNVIVDLPDGSKFYWNDNSTTLAVGVNYAETKHLSTYAAYYKQSGDFLDTTTGKIEEKSEAQMRVGFTASY